MIDQLTKRLQSAWLEFFFPAALLWMFTTPSWAQSSPSTIVQKVIIDTDIGSNVDDAYALTLLTSLRSANILGVTTVSGATDERARLAAKLLTKGGGANIPVYAGARSNQPLNQQCEWARGFSSPQLRNVSAVEFLYEQIKRAPGEITLIAIGPLTNLGELFRQHPIAAKQIKSIFIMGGAFNAGYDGKPPVVAEHNIESDPIAARTVLRSGAPVTMIGLDATAMMQLDERRQKKLLALGTPVTDALAALTALWGNRTPTLFDPMAVAYALGYRFADEKPRHILVEDDGLTRVTEGPSNARVVFDPQKDAFLDWYIAAHAQEH